MFQLIFYIAIIDKRDSGCSFRMYYYMQDLEKM